MKSLDGPLTILLGWDETPMVSGCGEIQKRSRLRIGHLPWSRTISMSSLEDLWYQHLRTSNIHFIDPLWASSSGWDPGADGRPGDGLWAQLAWVVRSCNLTLLVAFISQKMLRNPQQRRQADIHDVGYRKLLISWGNGLLLESLPVFEQTWQRASIIDEWFRRGKIVPKTTLC